MFLLGENIAIFLKNLLLKNKISFTLKSNKKFELSAHIGVNEHHKDEKSIVPNAMKLFKISFLYFDLTNWLLMSNIKRTTFKS